MPFTGTRYQLPTFAERLRRSIAAAVRQHRAMPPSKEERENFNALADIRRRYLQSGTRPRIRPAAWTEAAAPSARR